MSERGTDESDLEGRLTLEAGCLRLRTWRYRVEPTVSPAALAEALVARGWVDDSRVSALREVRHPDGHRILIVPHTGRVQIRLDLAVPEPERRATAVAIALDLQAALAPIEPTGGEGGA